jgi:hypothetical protein
MPENPKARQTTLDRERLIRRHLNQSRSLTVLASERGMSEPTARE